MGDYSYIQIGKFAVKEWKWELPPENDPILNFIFLMQDKIVEIDADLQRDEGITEYYCKYETNVSEVKSRFDKSHFTVKEIDHVISEVTGIPISDIETALMDSDIYYEAYLSDLENEKCENRAELEDLFDKKIELDYKIRSSDLGNYIELRNLREILDQSENTDLVSLEIQQITGNEEELKSFDHINLVTEDLTSATRIDKKYLEMAKIHYTEYHFDLVYIELFISVESALSGYFRRKSEQDEINLEGTFKNVKLMDKIKFTISFIGKQELDDELISSINDAYHVRNNKIHNNQKNFERNKVIKAIEDVERLVEIINSLE
ncbi:hypothetical protein [Methanolobus sp. ZRKC5]|uniref:hypothetical protein n=1 Tax=unclassified Methanolobus TaxID=2629569 RepID=UPI00313BC782